MYVDNFSASTNHRGGQTVQGKFLIVFDSKVERVKIGGLRCKWCGTTYPDHGVCSRQRWASIVQHGPVVFEHYGDGEHGWQPRTAPALYGIVRHVRMTLVSRYG